jgi:flavin-dependent thymidylate synthase
MYAKIVWDGKTLEVPCDMGCPKEDQLKGSDLDNLVELAGRVCYDSLGNGRDSVEYHKHIIEVDHGSVQEHANLTFAIPLDVPNYLGCVEALMNRPGIWMCKEVPTIVTKETGAGFNLRITANLRSIREWFEFPPMNKLAFILGQQMQHLAKKKAPLVLQDLETKDIGFPLQLVEPKYENEMWVSIFFNNVSRNWSHEQVRHRGNISQRSTRYVDEQDSNWCWHPILDKYLSDEKDLIEENEKIRKICMDQYTKITNMSQQKLTAIGLDKLTARKQARACARGILGTCLETEMIFSTSISHWKHIIKMRAHTAADAEIRLVYNEVFDILKERFPNSFNNWQKHPCKDGMGCEIKEMDENKI